MRAVGVVEIVAGIVVALRPADWSLHRRSVAGRHHPQSPPRRRLLRRGAARLRSLPRRAGARKAERDVRSSRGDARRFNTARRRMQTDREPRDHRRLPRRRTRRLDPSGFLALNYRVQTLSIAGAHLLFSAVLGAFHTVAAPGFAGLSTAAIASVAVASSSQLPSKTSPKRCGNGVRRSQGRRCAVGRGTAWRSRKRIRRVALLC